jgi:hypothetical protein
LVSPWVAATSIASEIAMPRLPGLSGVRDNVSRPNRVSVDGLGTQRAPNVSMNARRYGFWSYDTRTMKTSTSRPKSAPAKASDEPHCPAPVSVAIFFMPAAWL